MTNLGDKRQPPSPTSTLTIEFKMYRYQKKYNSGPIFKQNLFPWKSKYKAQTLFLFCNLNVVVHYFFQMSNVYGMKNKLLEPRSTQIVKMRFSKKGDSAY